VRARRTLGGVMLSCRAGGAAPTVDRVMSATVGALLIVLGLRSLFNAPDPDAQTPRWRESISSMAPAKAFAFGIVSTNLLKIRTINCMEPSCTSSRRRAAHGERTLQQLW